MAFDSKEDTMAAPLLQAQVDVDAPVAKVWALVSDLSRRSRTFWPTTSTVAEVIPEKGIAFRVNINHTVWCYELDPTDTGTRVTETRHAENGVNSSTA
jgi:hypothetical protein